VARLAAALVIIVCGSALPAAGASTDSLIDGIHSTRFVASDGVTLHVFEAGPGASPAGTVERAPVIAFVPGWSMPAAIWGAQLKALAATYRVAALDPRGQGESEVPAGGYTIERRAADVHEFIARYPRVVLVGWSLGALEALQALHRHGVGTIAALVLVDSSVGEDPASPPTPAFADALKRDRRAAMDGFVRAIFRSPRPEAELHALTASALRMPLEASLSLFPSHLPRAHWRGIVHAYEGPLLYVTTVQFSAQADALQRNRPATQVAIFEAAGHALFVDEAERFNRMLKSFVDAIPSPGR
jgi:non-heme chloroperoxidase